MEKEKPSPGSGASGRSEGEEPGRQACGDHSAQQRRVAAMIRVVAVRGVLLPAPHHAWWRCGLSFPLMFSTGFVVLSFPLMLSAGFLAALFAVPVGPVAWTLVMGADVTCTSTFFRFCLAQHDAACCHRLCSHNKLLETMAFARRITMTIKKG